MATKSLDGLITGDFDDVFVAENVLIKGNLTVDGTITGGSGPSVDSYFEATDTSNQFRAQSSTIDLTSTNSASPTFKLKNNAGVTTTSTLEVGQANVVNLGSTGISNSGTINTGTLTTGVLNSTSGGVGATTVTVSGQTTTGNLVTSLDTQSTGVASGAIVTPGGLGVAKAAHVGGQLHCTATTASTSTTTGALRVSGGVGIAGDVYVGGTINAPATSVTTSNVSGTTTTGNLAATTANVSGTTTTGTLAATTSNTSGTTTTGTLNVTGGGGVSVTNNISTAGLTVGSNGLVVNGNEDVSGAVNVVGLIKSESEVRVNRTGAAEMSVYNNGGNTEWVFGQRSASDHNFSLSSKIGSTVTPVAVFNREGDQSVSRSISTKNLLAKYQKITGESSPGGGIFPFMEFTNPTSGYGGLTISHNTTYGNPTILNNSADPLDVVVEGTSKLVVKKGTGSVGVKKSTPSADFHVGGTAAVDSTLTALSVVSTTSVSGVTLSSSGNTTVGGNLGVTGITTLEDPFVQNDPLDADDSSPGSVFTWGGLKAVKKVYAGGGVVIPYGQAIQANTAFGTKAKIMQTGFSVAGGLPLDATYLFTPGSSIAASTDFVLGVNAQTCILPQTTTSTSTTTGALTVGGGVGIAGNLNVGGTITGGSVSYSSTSSGTFAVTNGSGTTLTVASTTTSTSPTTGSATFAGGVGIAGNLNVGGTITGGSISYASTSTGSLAVTNSPGTTVSVSSSEDTSGTTTGAMTVVGGVGVGKALSVGGNLLMGLTPTNGVRYMALYNSSTDPAAGISIAFDTAAAGSPPEIIMLGPNHATNANDMIVRNPAGNLLLYGSGNAGFYVGNTIAFCQLPYLVQNTNDAIAYNNASMVTSGGLAVAKNTRMGGNLVAGDIATDGGNSITVSNQSGGTNAYAMITLDTQAVGNSNIFMNGPNRTADGGANTLTVRNDAGLLRLQGTAVTVPNTTASTSTTTGALQVGGGVGVVGNAFVGGLITSESEVRVQRTGSAEMSVYNNGSTNEWLFGQRSASDHDFTFSWKAGATIAPVARINTGGKLKLGNGAFFGYDEGTFSGVLYVNGFPSTPTFANGYYVKTGRQCTVYIASKTTSPGSTGVYWFMDLPFPAAHNAQFLLDNASNTFPPSSTSTFVKAVIDSSRGLDKISFTNFNGTWNDKVWTGTVVDLLEVYGQFTYITA